MSQWQPVNRIVGRFAARQDEPFGSACSWGSDPSISTSAFKSHALGTAERVSHVESTIHARGPVLYVVS